jgi:hypothetical protein
MFEDFSQKKQTNVTIHARGRRGDDHGTRRTCRWQRLHKDPCLGVKTFFHASFFYTYYKVLSIGIIQILLESSKTIHLADYKK